MKFVLFLLIGLGLPAYGTVFETQIEQPLPNAGDYGEYRLWLPGDSHPDRILVVVWGSNQCSLGVVEDPAWERLAGSLHCALLGCCFYPQAAENRWDVATGGSGDSLLEAIRKLASLSEEGQLATAPLYLVGDSQGGQFAFSFASWQPSRTLGFVSLKGGQHDIQAVANAAGVPGLFVAGELDAPFRVANIKDVVSKGRALGAPWCLALEPGGSHSPDRCGSLVQSFLCAVARAPADRDSQMPGGSTAPSAVLATRMNPSRSWFPDSAFERDWAKFESGEFAASTVRLGFASKVPPSPATVAPGSLDFGSIGAGEKSQPFSLEVTRNEGQDWDSVSVLSGPHFSGTDVARISPSHFTIYTRLVTTDLSLGRFAGVLPLRFESHGKTVLGGVNVPVTATVTGDVMAAPSFILLGHAQPNEPESMPIKITSKTKQPIRLVGYEAPPEITLEAPVMATQPLVIVVTFTSQKRSKSSSGVILLRVKTDREWTLRIPYINSLTR